MNIADFTRELAKAGATPEAIAVAVEAVESFRKLPETSGKATKYEWEIWRKVERQRKRPSAKNPSKISEKLEAGEIAACTDFSTPEFSGKVVVLRLTKKNQDGIQGKEVRKKSSENTRARGTRIKAGAIIPEEWRQWAEAEGATGIDAMWLEFVDYWIGVSGQKGVKSDWFATWRNNVRRNVRMRKNGSGIDDRKSEWIGAQRTAGNFGRSGDRDADSISEGWPEARS